MGDIGFSNLITSIDNIEAAIASVSSEATLNSILTELQQKADLTETQPVSVASLPLPAGAATESTLSALNSKVTACNTGSVTIGSALPAGTNNIGDVDIASMAHGFTIDRASGSYSSTAELQLIAAAGAGIKNKVFHIEVTCGGATASSVIVQLLDGSGGGQIWGATLYFPDNGMAGVSRSIAIPSALCETSANKGVYLKLSAAVTVYYNVSSFREA